MATDIEIDNLLRQIIAEDIGCGDITTEVCINSDRQALGTLHIKQKGIIAGLPFLAALFHIIDSSVSVELLVPEGSYQLAGTAVAELKGPARALITGKRCAVDLLQHISGIANATAAYVRKVSACPCAILDTRKTRPGLRFFEKYAVRIGGGTNHRSNLSDRLIIKTNHLSFLGPITATVLIQTAVALRERAPGKLIDVEVNTVDLAEKALIADIDGLMLHGMSPNDVRKCVQKAHARGKKAYFASAVELSTDALLAFARTGVDGIAIGSLITTAFPMDIGMRLQPVSSSFTTSFTITKATDKAQDPSFSSL